ncbi:5957_t:CDS:2, partial [Gigaspora rosea]
MQTIVWANNFIANNRNGTVLGLTDSGRIIVDIITAAKVKHGGKQLMNDKWKSSDAHILNRVKNPSNAIYSYDGT